jgi:hypothetical protein
VVNSKLFYSKAVTNPTPIAVKTVGCGGSHINFNTATKFELADSSMNLIQKDCASAINISKLEPGIYYLDYGYNTRTEFIIRNKLKAK